MEDCPDQLRTSLFSYREPISECESVVPSPSPQGLCSASQRPPCCDQHANQDSSISRAGESGGHPRPSQNLIKSPPDNHRLAGNFDHRIPGSSDHGSHQPQKSHHPKGNFDPTMEGSDLPPETLHHHKLQPQQESQSPHGQHQPHPASAIHHGNGNIIYNCHSQGSVFVGVANGGITGISNNYNNANSDEDRRRTSPFIINP